MPIAPYIGTGTDRPPLTASTSTSSTPGSTPDPPAAIWLTRTTSIARLSSGGDQRPAAAGVAAHQPQAVPGGVAALTAVPRFAPTPVVRP